MSQSEAFDSPPTPASLSADPAAVNGTAVDESAPPPRSLVRQGLSTFAGVYAPSILAMLAVIPFLREGWIVAESGLLGAASIALLTFTIAGSAAACLASVMTNARDRRSGFHGLLGRSLGYEPAGVISTVLLVGQTLAVALYLYGFAEAWAYVFPGHSRVVVAYAALLFVAAAALAPHRHLTRAQAVAVGLFALALGSVVLGLADAGTVRAPLLWGRFDGNAFWLLFAVLFPAGLGVEMGGSGYGVLEEPRRSLPRGMIAAAATAAGVCVVMAIWYAVVPAVRPGRMAAVEYAASGELVLVAVLVAASVAAVATLRSVRRTVQELAALRLVAGRRASRAVGDERTATIVAAVLAAVALLVGSLDRLLLPLTLAYLTLYLSILVATALERRLGMIAFRPTFRVPGWVMYAGIVACLAALFGISSTFALAVLLALGALYVYLARPERRVPDEFVRSSAFEAFARGAARGVDRSPTVEHERAWTPDLLVPVESRRQLDGIYRFLQWTAAPSGSLRIVGVRRPGAAAGRFRKPTAGLADRDLFLRPETDPEPQVLADPRDELDLSAATATLRRLHLPTTASVIEAPTLVKGIASSASLFRSGVMPPNVLLGLAHLYDPERLFGITSAARAHDMGLALLYLDEESGFGYERAINLWVSDHSVARRRGLHLPDLDLALLLSYQICRNWNGRLRLCTVIGDASDVSEADAFLTRLIHDARLPADTERWTARGRFMEHLGSAPAADLHILGLPKEVDLAFLKAVVRLTGHSCLFARGSGPESAFA